MTSSKTIDPNALYSPKETEVILNMSGSWLAKSRMRGDGPRFIVMGRSVKYRGIDLIEYIKSKMRHSTSEYPRHRAADHAAKLALLKSEVVTLSKQHGHANAVATKNNKNSRNASPSRYTSVHEEEQ